MVEPFLTLEEICARYHVSDRRARDIVRDHAVPVLKPGRKWLFDEIAERAFVEASRLHPLAPALGKTRKLPRSTANQAAYERALAACAPHPRNRA